MQINIYLAILYINKIVKYFFGKSNSSLKFHVFENKVHPETYKKHSKISSWAEEKWNCINISEHEDKFLQSDNLLVKQGFQLRKETLKYFKNLYCNRSDLRIIIHSPSRNQSIAGNSLFNNLADGLKYLGITTKIFYSGENVKEIFNSFSPTLFLTSDNDIYKNSIDWDFLCHYKLTSSLKIGLTASIEEYGNSSLLKRLTWAKHNLVDFYYSFRAQEYIHARQEYSPFFNEGYKIYTIEFGANPLYYYPVPNIVKDINYSFFASKNPDKHERYFKYLSNILTKYPGFIDGPGWSHNKNYIINRNLHRYIYSRSKIGINLHISDSINWASELNERTYILAMCGVPQLIDNPKLLSKRFSESSIFACETPDEYEAKFDYLINNYETAEKTALLALNEVFAKHTSFHRAEDLIIACSDIFDRPDI